MIDLSPLVTVLRRYGKPDMIDDRPAHFLTKCLPIALLIHTLFALACYRFQSNFVRVL